MKKSRHQTSGRSSLTKSPTKIGQARFLKGGLGVSRASVNGQVSIGKKSGFSIRETSHQYKIIYVNASTLFEYFKFRNRYSGRPLHDPTLGSS